MLIEYRVNAVQRVVTVTITGDIDDQTFVTMHRDLEKNPSITKDFSLLVDLRAARGESVTSDGVRALARLPLLFSATSRRAVVVPSDLGYGMARMYEGRRGEMGSVMPFRDMASARQWLGLDRPGRE